MKLPTDVVSSPSGRLATVVANATFGVSFGTGYSGPVRSSLEHSQGMASGMNKPLRLEIHDPDLIAYPGKYAAPAWVTIISLSPQQLLFSRTASDVELPPLPKHQGLSILLV